MVQSGGIVLPLLQGFNIGAFIAGLEGAKMETKKVDQC